MSSSRRVILPRVNSSPGGAAAEQTRRTCAINNTWMTHTHWTNMMKSTSKYSVMLCFISLSVRLHLQKIYQRSLPMFSEVIMKIECINLCLLLKLQIVPCCHRKRRPWCWTVWPRTSVWASSWVYFSRWRCQNGGSSRGSLQHQGPRWRNNNGVIVIAIHEITWNDVRCSDKCWEAGFLFLVTVTLTLITDTWVAIQSCSLM